jgi:hypothetical protein
MYIYVCVCTHVQFYIASNGLQVLVQSTQTHVSSTTQCNASLWDRRSLIGDRQIDIYTHREMVFTLIMLAVECETYCVEKTMESASLAQYRPRTLAITQYMRFLTEYLCVHLWTYERYDSIGALALMMTRVHALYSLSVCTYVRMYVRYRAGTLRMGGGHGVLIMCTYEYAIFYMHMHEFIVD